jgi:riboflavin kinase/FMN adenylyltransferase
MIIVDEIAEIPKMPTPCGLTIGSFDGVHLGHQYLLKHLRSRVGPSGSIAVLTFRNHPSHVLTHRPQATPLCTLEEKIDLLEKAGVNLLILLSFTPTLAQLSYEQFLRSLHAHYPFSHLVLGKGASFGKNREGTESRITALGQSLGFQAEYLDCLIRPHQRAPRSFSTRYS